MPDGGQAAGRFHAVAPAVTHGIRLSLAVSLSLWVAFVLQLSAPYWAATSAGLVCLPALGASLRKGQARLVGTVVGSVFIVVLTACFPQDRFTFLFGLAAWCAASAFLATLLDDSASYGASLAGYTAIIVAATLTGTPEQVFTQAISRASEISIGIVCATTVLIVTSRPRSGDKLAGVLAAIIAETAQQTLATLRRVGPDAADTRPDRRALIKRTIAARPQEDEAIGESSELRRRQATLRHGFQGILAALSEWRTIAGHLRRLSEADARREAQAVLDALPPGLGTSLASGAASAWTRDPVRLRDACARAARAFVVPTASEPSLQLLRSSAARWLLSMARAANGLVLLLHPAQARDATRHGTALGGKDLLPALVNGLRVFATVAALELFWIGTAWPSGMAAIIFATINVVLMSPKNEQAYRAITVAAVGVGVAALLAGTVKFALLPAQDSFPALCLILGMILVPFGALTAVPRLTPLVTPMLVNVLPFLAITNRITYDPSAFYDQMLATMSGCAAAAVALHVIPPVRPQRRAARLLAATLEELRELASGEAADTRASWEARVYNRLSAMPQETAPVQAGRLVAALAVGTELIRLRLVADRFGLQPGARAFLVEMARGDDARAVAALERLNAELAGIPRDEPGGELRLRARSSLLALVEALDQHADVAAGRETP